MRNAIGQLNIRIDDELNSAFIEKSRKNNTSPHQLLIKYIKQYLETPHKGESQKIEELKKRLLKVEQILAELAGF